MLTGRKSSSWLTLIALLPFPVFSEVIAFKNFTLIDGNGGPAIADAGMVIDNGRITWIGSAAKLKAPADALVVDLPGKYVMPGIVNLHGHPGGTIDMTQDPKNFTRQNLEKDLRTYASYGVTAVLSLGTDQDLIFKIRDEQRAGRPTYTRVFSAGQGFTFDGSVGGMPGVTYTVSNAGQVPKMVDELATKKVDMVKMWVDDGMGRQKKMPYAISKAIIDNAHVSHLRVAAHIFYLADAKQLVNGGLDALAHSVRDQPVDPELIESMKNHNTWQAAATLVREESTFIYAKPAPFLSDPFFTRSVSTAVLSALYDPDSQHKIEFDPDFPKFHGLLEMAQKNLKRLSDAGIRYGLGTDSGVPGRFPGFFELREMELMVDAGLTPTQVITAATKRGGEFLGAKDLGTLEVGKWADLIILGDNPMANIRNMRSIETVLIAGKKVAP
jgi:imidazolonepropionase-like amidohydrolase